MKYIRTKDGIGIVDYQRPNGDYVTFNIGYIPKDLILKQADTIEELCDEFDIIVKGKHHHYYDMEQVKWVIEQVNEERVYINQEQVAKIGAIYGAVWTDKGLIYVAKMNDKGALELL